MKGISSSTGLLHIWSNKKKKLCPINFIVQMYVNEFFHRAIEKLLEDCSVPSRSTRN